MNPRSVLHSALRNPVGCGSRDQWSTGSAAAHQVVAATQRASVLLTDSGHSGNGSGIVLALRTKVPTSFGLRRGRAISKLLPEMRRCPRQGIEWRLADVAGPAPRASRLGRPLHRLPFSCPALGVGTPNERGGGARDTVPAAGPAVDSRKSPQKCGSALISPVI